MIKAASSGAAGVTGSIHALAGGTAGAQFTAAPGPKLRATGTSGTGQFVFANNSTQSLADFDGTDATGAATGLTFGAGNNANNTAYINSLRNAGPATEPTAQASNVTFGSVTATLMTVSWTSGNGSSRIVLAKEGAPVDAVPADGTSYTANPAFGSGSQLNPATATTAPASAVKPRRVSAVSATPNVQPVAAAMAVAGPKGAITKAVSGGAAPRPARSSSPAGGPAPPVKGTAVAAGGGNYVVFAGTGNSVTVMNLRPSTTYYFAVFEFNGANTSTNYLTTGPATGSQSTAQAFQIGGTVRSRGGAGLSGVALTLSTGDTPLANTVTDSSGHYTFSDVTAGGDYTVEPSSSSFTFSPDSASFTSLAADQTADFTGTPRVIISEFRFCASVSRLS